MKKILRFWWKKAICFAVWRSSILSISINTRSRFVSRCFFSFNCMHNKMRQSNNQIQLFNSLYNCNSAMCACSYGVVQQRLNSARVSERERESDRESRGFECIKRMICNPTSSIRKYGSSSSTNEREEKNKRNNYYKERQRTHSI